jgi:hypothetical protein
MRTLRPTALFVLALVIPASLSAQQSASTAAATPPATDPQAAALVQRALAALTGGSPVTDVTMTGTVTANNGSTTQSGTITLVATVAGQSRVTVALPSGTWISTQDFAASPRTSTSIGSNGVAQDAAPEELMGPSPAWFYPALVIGAAVPNNYVTAYVDQETRNGSAVHHVAIWPQAASSSPIQSFQAVGQQVLTGPAPAQPLRPGQQELYLDSASLLPETLVFRVRGYRAKNSSPDLTRPVSLSEEVHFSDYRQVQGRVAAFHIQMSIAGISLMDIQLSSVSFNTGATVAAD